MGHIEIALEELLRGKSVSKNKLCKNCQLQRTQLNNYCKNEVSRVDLSVLARICDYLDCSVSDILIYKK